MKECSSSLSSSSSLRAGETDESDSSQLLPDLSDDVALECIARIQCFDYRNLALVSKSWRSMLRSPVFFSSRSRLKCTRHLLFLNVDIYDTPSKWFAVDLNPKNPRILSPGPRLPSLTNGSAFTVLGPRIYVLGGSINNKPSSTVRIFDSRSNSLEIGPQMHVGREFAAADVLDGKIYVMGGCSQTTNWVEVFDAAIGCWTTVPSPIEVRRESACVHRSAFMEKKFYAVDSVGGFVFDPCNLSCRNAPTELDRGWKNEASVFDGILYCCDYSGRISGFDIKEGKWKTLNWLLKDLPNYLCSPTMVNVGGRLFVVWEGEVINRILKIYCAEVEVRKDNDGGLWGSIVWSQSILEVPQGFYIARCLAVEL